MKAGIVAVLAGLSARLPAESNELLVSRLSAGLSAQSELLHHALGAALARVVAAAAMPDAQNREFVSQLLERVRALRCPAAAASTHDALPPMPGSWMKVAALRTGWQLLSPPAARACWMNGASSRSSRCAGAGRRCELREHVPTRAALATTQAVVQDKGASAAAKENAFLAFQLLSSQLGPPFEPYMLYLMPVVLASIGDTMVVVREAAEGAAHAVANHIAAQGVSLVMPALLDAMGDRCAPRYVTRMLRGG